MLLVDKPEGPTSHDVVAAVRRALGMRRVGHAGTLDPFASGLLLLCSGAATRLAEYATALDKRYDATLRLGLATDTDDSTGAPIAVSDAWRRVSQEALLGALRSQTGEIMQLSPAYSAKKVAGQRSHRLARRGDPVALPPVPVRVHAIELLDFAPPDVDVRVSCASGTYIRAIARDVGEELGCHAHLVRLRRTAIGPFDVRRALPFDRLQPDRARAALLPPIAAVAHLPRIEVGPDSARRLARGQRVPMPGAAPDAECVITTAGELVAIATCEDGVLRPRKVFAHD